MRIERVLLVTSGHDGDGDYYHTRGKISYHLETREGERGPYGKEGGSDRVGYDPNVTPSARVGNGKMARRGRTEPIQRASGQNVLVRQRWIRTPLRRRTNIRPNLLADPREQSDGRIIQAVRSRSRL